MGTRSLVLPASVLENPPLADVARAATAAGFDALSLWPGAGYGATREHRRVVHDAGLTVFDVDALVAWVGPDDPGAPYFEEAPPGAVWSAAEALAASSVNVLLVGPQGTPVDAAAGTLARLADEGAERGLRVTLEFARGTAAPDLGAAARIIAATDRANAGLMIDSWHLHWTGGTAAAVAALPGRLVAAAQLSDVPAAKPEHLRHASRYNREVPGTGVADLHGLLAALDTNGSAAPLVLEVFNQRLLGVHGVDGYARLLAQSMRQLPTT